MLYKEVLKMWIEEKSHYVRSNTIKSYKQNIKKWISPYFGLMDILDITKECIQDFINDLSKNHKKETIMNMVKVLKQPLDYAVEKEIIKETPYKNIKIGRTGEIKEIKVFTEEEASKLISACKYSHVKDIIILAYRTGMRIGEILALRHEDINFEQHFLTVKRTLSGYSDNGELEISDPKTKSSRRRIELDNITLEMLIKRFDRKSGEYVFCKSNGDIYSRQGITQPYKKVCEDANVKYRCFHTLRHTHASVLLSKNVHPKIVQERLGHSKISTTMDTYSHLIPGMQRLAVDVFNNIN